MPAASLYLAIYKIYPKKIIYRNKISLITSKPLFIPEQVISLTVNCYYNFYFRIGKKTGNLFCVSNK